MDKNELRKRLVGLGIRNDAYSLDGELINDAWIVDENYGEWVVFYFERGSRYNEKIFKTKNLAYEFIFQILKDEPSVRT